MTITMTDFEAVAYAATWGSYMSGGDPGACMYGFSPDDGFKVQSEQHRTNCLEWIKGCKKNVEDYDMPVEDEDPQYEEDEMDKLDCLEQMVINAPLGE